MNKQEIAGWVVIAVVVVAAIAIDVGLRIFRVCV